MSVNSPYVACLVQGAGGRVLKYNPEGINQYTNGGSGTDSKEYKNGAGSNGRGAKPLGAGGVEPSTETVRETRSRLFNVDNGNEPASKYSSHAKEGESVKEMRDRLFDVNDQDSPTKGHPELK